MRTLRLSLLSTLLFTIASLSLVAQDRAKQNWPQWRGPLGTGAAPAANPPLEWSEIKNVRWRMNLPGMGHSTPIVWQDKIFLTTAIPFGPALKPRFSGAPGAHDNLPVSSRHKFVALAVDRDNGELLWQQVLKEALPHEGGHNTASLASQSPVTDGTLLFASFGSQGIYCLDLEGTLIWKVDLGRMQTKHGHGEGSSPVLSGNTLVVNWDHEGDSFVVALDKSNGRERWRIKRDEVTSWATPITVKHGKQTQLIVSGTSRIRSYDLQTGKSIWECGGLSANIVCSPVAGHGMVFAGSSYEKQAMMAIRLEGASGDITGSDLIRWSRFRGTPYVPSSLLYKESLYFLRHYQGILTRIEAVSGEEKQGPFRLGGIRNVYASPVAADNRVYITDLDGTTMVLSHEDQPRILAMNQLNDSFSASAAIVDSEIILRGQRKLYSISEQ
jgi:outer membrane protein assembly factor BamB